MEVYISRLCYPGKLLAQFSFHGFIFNLHLSDDTFGISCIYHLLGNDPQGPTKEYPERQRTSTFIYSTIPSSVTTTTSKLCLYGGDYYPPNTNLSTGSSMVDNWCHGVIIDNFNCFPSTTTAITTPTIPPPFSLCPHNGQELNPGEIIPTDDQWCSGVTCTIDGLQIWHY